MAAVQFYWQFTTDATLRVMVICTPPLETTAAHISKTAADILFSNNR